LPAFHPLVKRKSRILFLLHSNFASSASSLSFRVMQMRDALPENSFPKRHFYCALCELCVLRESKRGTRHSKIVRVNSLQNILMHENERRMKKKQDHNGSNGTRDKSHDDQRRYWKRKHLTSRQVCLLSVVVVEYGCKNRQHPVTTIRVLCLKRW
jgi:hypothetical protein